MTFPAEVYIANSDPVLGTVENIIITSKRGMEANLVGAYKRLLDNGYTQAIDGLLRAPGLSFNSRIVEIVFYDRGWRYRVRPDNITYSLGLHSFEDEGYKINFRGAVISSSEAPEVVTPQTGIDYRDLKTILKRMGKKFDEEIDRKPTRFDFIRELMEEDV